GDVLDQQRVELAPVAADDAGAVAQQFVGARGGKQENLGARQPIILAVVQPQDEVGGLLPHDAVGAVGREKTVRVDAAETGDYRRILYLAVLTHEGRQAGHGGNVGVAAGVDRHLGPHRQAPLLGIGGDALDLL